MLVYATKINGTKQSGLIDVATKKIFCLCDEEAGREIIANLSKARNYDLLKEKIGKYYEDNASGDLMDIGEAAAHHFGYL